LWLFFVFFALALVTTYNMSCGVSYVFVGFFSSRVCRWSWIFFYGVSQRHGFSVVVGNCLVFVVGCLGLLGVECRGSCTLAFLTMIASLRGRV